MPTQTRTQQRLNQQDTDLLVEFLRSLEMVLDATITSKGHFIPQEFRKVFLAGWREVRPTIDELVEAIESHQFDAKLRANGLTGPQLAMKMALYKDALNTIQAFFSAYTEIVSPTPAQTRPSSLKQSLSDARKKGRKLLQLLFKPANVILGSITKAIPLAEMLREMKGITEAGLDHADHYESLEKKNMSKEDWAEWIKIGISLGDIASKVFKQKP